MWVLYERIVATVINVILGIFLLIFIHNGREIYEKLHVSDDDAVTGQFKDFGIVTIHGNEAIPDTPSPMFTMDYLAIKDLQFPCQNVPSSDQSLVSKARFCVPAPVARSPK